LKPSIELYGMPEHRFAPGFRLSAIDVLVLIIGGISAAALGALDPWLGIAIGFVVGHFFLFCNVFRVARTLELTWAGVYVAISVCTVWFSFPGWPLTYLATTVATAIVVTIELRKLSYHGTWWQRINPGLREWWDR